MTDVSGEEPDGIHTDTISDRIRRLHSPRGKSLDKKRGTGSGLGPQEWVDLHRWPMGGLCPCEGMLMCS